MNNTYQLNNLVRIYINRIADYLNDSRQTIGGLPAHKEEVKQMPNITMLPYFTICFRRFNVTAAQSKRIKRLVFKKTTVSNYRLR